MKIKKIISANVEFFGAMFSSLKTRNFLLYFIGQCISLTGSWIQYVAMSWLVYRLTGSIILLATVALLNQLPSLLLTPFAGVMSDRFDKFKIILGGQILFMCQALLLSFLVLSDRIEVWHLLALSLFSGIIAAVEAPSRQSFYSQLVAKKEMTNAIALNSVTINGSRFVGPTIAGILIALVGEGYCFLINGLSYIAVIGALLMMTLQPFVRVVKESKFVDEFKEGLYYIRNFLPLKATLIFIAAISFFGLPFMSIIPALVKDTLGGNSTLLGYVNSSIGAGALVAALYLASRKNIAGLGLIVTISGVVMGVSLILISMTKNEFLACLLGFPLGCTLIGSMAATNTLLQSLVDDDKRGRVMSFFTMAFAGVSPVGGMVYGWVAEKSSLPITILCSGVICIIVAGIYEIYRPRIWLVTHKHYYRKRISSDRGVGWDEIVENPF